MASTSTTTTTTTTKKTTMQQSFILVDESGSMSGQKTSDAKSQVSQYMSTCGANDIQLYGFENGIRRISNVNDIHASGGTYIAKSLSQMFKIIKSSTYGTVTFLIITDAEDDISSQKTALRKEFESVESKHPTIHAKLCLIGSSQGAAKDIEYVLGPGSVLEGDAEQLRKLVAKMTKMAKESAKMTSGLNVVVSNAATTINDIDQADAAIEKISNSQQVVTNEVKNIKQALLDIESEARELENKIGSGKLSAIYKSVESVEADINKGEKYLDDCDKERTKIKQKKKTLATIRKSLEVVDNKTEEFQQKVKRLQNDYDKARERWKSSGKTKSSTAALRIATSKVFSARSQLNTVGMKIHREQKKLRKNLMQLEESEGQNIALEKRIAKSLDTLDAYLDDIR